MNEKEKFGKRLKALRQSSGLTQDEFAKALGYSGRSAINKIEVGINGMPKAMVLRAAKLLGVDPMLLFQLDDDVQLPSNQLDIDLAFRNAELLILVDKLSDGSRLELKKYAEFLLSKEGDTK